MSEDLEARAVRHPLVRAELSEPGEDRGIPLVACQFKSDGTRLPERIHRAFCPTSSWGSIARVQPG